MTQTPNRSNIIVAPGQKIRFTQSHPWAGNEGRVIRFEDTPWGTKPVVEIESTGVRCFIMQTTDFISIQE